MLLARPASDLAISAANGAAHDRDDGDTRTPIKHLIVIFDENNSFDHYFGTYPYATNPPNEPAFVPRPDTPTVNGLTHGLIASNPNAAPPFRLDRSQASTCDNSNKYTAEQKAYNAGLVNGFHNLSCADDLAMGYYDGNTVTALWNYAQHFAISDNFFADTYGTTVMGHLNLISGQTHSKFLDGTSVAGTIANGSIIANVDPVLDDCSTGTVVMMSSLNVGDLLNAHNVTWGWFYGDWQYSTTPAACQSFNPHYAPFQYYASTANPHHLPPTSVSTIGQTDQANHQYTLDDFWNAVSHNRLPSVVFLKPPKIQTGHPSDSTPLAEQQFLVQTINRLQQTPEWNEMAIVITYDDSDGWYDHVMPPIMSQSHDGNDALLGPGSCGTLSAGAYNDRCGFGPRLPFLVISPFAKVNYVDHRLTDQSSILRFIEDNWRLGRIADQSFDAIAGSILGLFDFDDRRDHAERLLLNWQTGEPIR
jgi:phospholipase C